MRKLRPQQKERRKVTIPTELRESLREVFELIEESKTDPDIRLDYDDAIQVGAVCGGRCGVKPRPYVLTYFPTGDAERGRWFLTLHRTEIEDIGDGRMDELSLFCCVSQECRCKFREPEEHCFYCDYFDDPNYGNFMFPDAESKLSRIGVQGLVETSTREEVIATLGSPAETGGGVKHQNFGYIWPWINYRRADCQLRIEFNKTCVRIRSVTIMEPDWEPGKRSG